jgi:hypothetical protein
LHALLLCLKVMLKNLSFHPQWWLCSAIRHYPYVVAKDEFNLPTSATAGLYINLLHPQICRQNQMSDIYIHIQFCNNFKLIPSSKYLSLGNGFSVLRIRKYLFSSASKEKNLL